MRKDSSKEARYAVPLPPAVFQILVALADQDRHGYAIMQDVAARTDGQMKLSPGTLYGSIKRMLGHGKGLIPSMIVVFVLLVISPNTSWARSVVTETI